MQKFHINWEGVVARCDAEKIKCQFGGDAQHYASESRARAAYELSMSGNVFQTASKKETEAPARLVSRRDLEEMYDASEDWVTVSDYNGSNAELHEEIYDALLRASTNGEDVNVLIRKKNGSIIVDQGLLGNYNTPGFLSANNLLTLKNSGFVIPLEEVEAILVYKVPPYFDTNTTYIGGYHAFSENNDWAAYLSTADEIDQLKQTRE